MLVCIHFERENTNISPSLLADGEKEKKGKKGPAAGKKKKVKNAKQNSDDEAIEESDEGDYDDREVDYMSDSSRWLLSVLLAVWLMVVDRIW